MKVSNHVLLGVEGTFPQINWDLTIILSIKACCVLASKGNSITPIKLVCWFRRSVSSQGPTGLVETWTETEIIEYGIVPSPIYLLSSQNSH